MSDHLSRITMRKTTVSGSCDDVLICTGYLVAFEPEVPAKREIVRPVAPDEPDTEAEVGNSKNALEPLTLVFREKKVELTKSAFILFRYVNDLYRTEGQEEFDFSELAEILAGDECGKSRAAIGKLVRQIATGLAKIAAPVSVTYKRERLYVQNFFGHEN